jgi:hypothetical protein
LNTVAKEVDLPNADKVSEWKPVMYCLTWVIFRDAGEHWKILRKVRERDAQSLWPVLS